ncbi:MAG: carbamoyltransferase [Proteobacteria bacterium]|nr:carbamoyltransferase [Pseudomonadota bacterium]
MAKQIAVLGIHKDPWHNTGASIITELNGKVDVIHIAEERLDRKKDSRNFPERAITASMKHAGLVSFAELDLVVMDYICRGDDWKNDFFDTPCRSDVFLTEVDPAKIQVINHHLAHAAASFYASTFPESAILVVDGRGSDKETQSLFTGRGNKIRLIEKSNTIGIGLLYASITQLIGFGLLQEGKTMGLASYGSPEVSGTKIEKLLPIRGKFSGIGTDYSELCMEDSYELRVPVDVYTQERKAQAAFEVQKECEHEMLRLAQYARDVTGVMNLCIGGGVGLNSVANYKILQANIFDDLYINPACSDTGIALGAALWGYHAMLDRPRFAKTLSPFVGPVYSEQDLQDAMQPHCDLYRISGDASFEKAADLLAQNFIVGCFQGRSEMGPRALGNRSILMSPLKAENKDILNAKVKFRESFRPFAPACMLEHVQEYFEINVPSPYMLLVPDVRPGKRKIIPAVTHFDGSGRLQTLTTELNPVFYLLASLFKQRTGVPVLLNTSFNVNGEPIVETPEDAIRCFRNTNIDALLMGEHLLIKQHVRSALETKQ